MSNTNSSKSKYVFAAVLGAAVGGSIIALSTRALPKMMSEMEGKCKQMMAGEPSCRKKDQRTSEVGD